MKTANQQGNKGITAFILISFFLCLPLVQYRLNSQSLPLIHQDDFSENLGWTFLEGEWKITGNRLTQYNTAYGNSNCYFKIFQSRNLDFEWEVVMHDGILDAGLHFFSSNGYLSERGNSYLVWQFKNGFVIYKTMVNHLREVRRFPGLTEKGKLYKNRVRYNSETGLIIIEQDNKEIGRWTDPSPLRRGDFISFRTNKTYASFSNLKIYRSL